MPDPPMFSYKSSSSEMLFISCYYVLFLVGMIFYKRYAIHNMGHSPFLFYIFVFFLILLLLLLPILLALLLLLLLLILLHRLSATPEYACDQDYYTPSLPPTTLVG